MIDPLTKEKIGWWLIKARNQKDPFVRFILYWFCFNTWLTNLSNKDNDRQAIDWFINNDSCLKRATENFWHSNQTQSILRNLQNQRAVYDMRPGRHKSVEIENINDLGQVVNYIYQIRCNLFHGSKNPNDPRDQSLVELSSMILCKWIELANVEC
jgi:hypothetical protein